ncbi:MAG: hypothetical protein CM1200mP41_33650 [Gammaproteobacteria bacterium]|nr:MAG: hypothetical protein CM1200mP41_33650 [Gammaproteobacteria bacterium]
MRLGKAIQLPESEVGVVESGGRLLRLKKDRRGVEAMRLVQARKREITGTTGAGMMDCKRPWRKHRGYGTRDRLFKEERRASAERKAGRLPVKGSLASGFPMMASGCHGGKLIAKPIS